MKYLKLVMLVFLCVVANLSAEDANINTKLKLGFIVPLSGPLAFFGTDLQHAVDLAIEADPSITQNIEILWEDSQYDSKQAVSVFNKLVNLDRVDIIYSFGGPMLSALAPLAETKEVPFFATESEVKDCEGRKYCSLFRNSADEWGQAFWQVARERKYKNIGIVKNENQFNNSLVNGIIRSKSSDESVEILINALPETSDFKTDVLKLKKEKIDAIGLYLQPTSHIGFMNSIRANRLKFEYIGTDFIINKNLNAGFIDLFEGSLSITPSISPKLEKEFKEKYGISPGIYYSIVAYDFINLLNEILIANPNNRKLELINALRFSGKKQGSNGEYAVKKASNGVAYYSFPISIHEVRDGTAHFVKEITF